MRMWSSYGGGLVLCTLLLQLSPFVGHLEAIDSIPNAEIKIFVQASYTADAASPDICIGEGNCYSLEGGSCLYDPSLPGWKGGNDVEGRCLVASYSGSLDDLADDHPFVQDPDQWDSIYLDLPEGSAITHMKRLVLALEYPGGPKYRFLDETFHPPLDFASGAITISMSHWVEERRQCVTRSAFCGYSDMSCHDKDPCMAQPEFQRVHQVPWNIFPIMVRESSKDIGQTGGWKYFRGLASEEDPPADNGCDEFYFYYASQFANNLHHPAAGTSFFPWEIAGINPGKWRRAGRLAEVIFVETTDGGRTLASPPVQRLGDDWMPTGEKYEPKAGDYFLVFSADKGKHAMIALDAIYLDPQDGHLKIPVIDKWILDVQAVTRDLNDWNGTDMVADSSWRFFFGEVDHELAGSQQHDATGFELSNFGFLAWFTTVVND